MVPTKAYMDHKTVSRCRTRGESENNTGEKAGKKGIHET